MIHLIDELLEWKTISFLRKANDDNETYKQL